MNVLNAYRLQLARLLPAWCIAALVFGATAPPAQAMKYAGPIDLPLAVSLVGAGGGPKHFSSLVLYKELTGPLQAAETAKLTQEHGAAQVADTFAIFDYAIDDVLGILTASKVALPAPVPAPGDAKALALALYAAGSAPGGKWDVGYMLEHMISHPVHHTIMRHIDTRYSPKQNAVFHVILSEMMHDLHAAYTATPAPVASAAPAPPVAPSPSSAGAAAPSGAGPATQPQPAPSPTP